jgi:HEAT repeats/Outer membrane lipoprotein
MARRYSILILAALALALAFGSASALAAKEDGAPTDRQSNALYWEGQAALKDSDWSKALKLFEDLEKLLRKNEPESADAALYWQAYALAQSKRTAEAKGVIERMRRQFPESRWNKDADALLVQTQPTAHIDAGSGDEELADIAVQALMSAPPERALPLLKKVLSSSRPLTTKKRALFVLSQLGTSEAFDAIIDTAKNASEPELRDEAIRMLGVSGSRAALERLSDIYATSTTAQDKRRVLEAWLIADRKDLVYAAARDESDESVRRKAIEVLGAMSASAELAQLLDTTRDAHNRHAIIQSLGVAGSTDPLVAIAGNTQLPEEERIAALQSLGIAGDRGGQQALRDLYAKADTPALRNAALQGLLIAGDTDSVIQLYKAARSADEKKALLRVLTQMDDDAAIDIIEDELTTPEGQ